MLDTLFQWLVVVLPLVLAVAIEQCDKEFRETVRYRRGILVCGILFSVITFLQMDRERHKSTTERETAIQETSEKVAAKTSASVSAELTRQYADTVASQALKVGELEGYIQSQGKNVRDVMKYTASNAARLNALWEETQTGKQKRQDVRERLNGYMGTSNSVLGPCRNVGVPNHGGTNAQVCINDVSSWVSGATGYISGSLGELYVNRFIQAGLRRNSEPPVLTGIDLKLDPYTASEVYWAMHELEAKANVLEEFIKELK